MPRRKEGKLIAFVLPNPNPDNDLAAPQIWAGEQGMGSASLGPVSVLPVAPESLSSSQEGLQSQHPALSGCLESISSCAITALLDMGLRKAPGDFWMLGQVALGLMEEVGGWGKCPEVLGWVGSLG